MRKRNYFYIGGGILLILILVAIFRPHAPKTTYDTAAVEKATLKQTVQVTGEVSSSEDVDLKFETSGRVTSIAKKVGDAVKLGDVLATLDDRNQRVDVQKASAALLSAQAGLDRVKNGTTSQDIHVAQVNVDNAQTALDKAKEALTDAQASNDASLAKAEGDLAAATETLNLKASTTMQILKNDLYSQGLNDIRGDISVSDSEGANRALASYAAARTASDALSKDMTAFRAAATSADAVRLAAAILADAQAIRDAAEKANALLQNVTPTGSTSQASFDADRNEVKAAWVDVSAAVNAAQAQAFVVSSVKASNSASLNVAMQGVKTAEGALASAQAALAVKQAPATSYDLESARASVTQAQATLGAAQLALDKTRIRAPFDGSIAQIPSRVGATVSPADVVLKVHGVQVFEIVADVPETDVAKLKPGMTASITLDAYGTSVPFMGTLGSIDSAQSVIQDVVYYKTRFMLAATDKPIRAGMTANIDVTTAERPDAIIIPQRAIRTNGGKFVRTLENGQEVKKTIETGLYGDDGKVEILSGLSVGETVVLATRQDGKLVTQ